jgi:serine protease Do
MTDGVTGWIAILLSLLFVGSANSLELPDFRQMVKESEPAIVNVSTTQKADSDGRQKGLGLPDYMEDDPFSEFFKRFFDERPWLPQDRQANSLGSGFIISADGYILTNAHVASKNADTIIVRLSDDREKPAKLIGADDFTDLALLKIDDEDLPTVKIGDSDAVEVGEWVLAIGSPFGLERTATQGIVSAVGRNLPSDAYVPFIQTDAAINPGNSGGPLFNALGQVIGVNSQIYSSTGGYMGLSFAVPIKLAMQVAEQLKETGEVTRGWLGVMIQNVNQELAESFDIEQASGALVSQILPDSPAAEAGIEVGDIIIRYGDELVEESSELPRMIGVTAVGKTVDLLVVRKGEPLQLKATIARLEVEEEITTIDERRADLLNMAVSELSDEQRRILNLDQRGVLVTEVDDGLAANAGIYPYDVILSVNYEDVTGTQQFIELIGGLPLGKAVPLLVLREDETIFLPLKLAGKE